MSSKKHVAITALSVISYIALSLLLFYQVIYLGFLEESSVVPISGLLDWQHAALFILIWPLLGSIILIPIIPRIVVPLFTKTKMSDVREGFIELDSDPLLFRTVVSRAIFTFLLVMGLESTIIPLFELTLFIPAGEYAEWLVAPYVPLHLHPNIFIVTAGMLFPIAISIFACVWTLEDSGLVHYDLPDDISKYQEISPVYSKLSNYLKGFAGFSALIYYISAIIEMIEFGTEQLTFKWVAFVSVIVFVWALVGILIYSKLNRNWVRKGLTKLDRIQNDS